jgi:sensor histidine kinase YesM
MNLHDFIFSDNRRYRISRHLCFWLGWFVFSGIAQITFNTANDKDVLANIGDLIFFQFFRSLGRFPSILMFCYFIVYFLAPKFIQKRKFVQFALWFFLSLFFLYVLTSVSLYFYIEIVRGNPFVHYWPAFAYFFNSFYSNINFTGAVPTCCLMLAIKYYKNWYIKQRKSEQLSRENIQAELQLLKAQIHPHFLFNTLNNIYSFVLTGDRRAAELVDKLAGMINYMRTEGENALVPLEKEISLIKDYTGLEKVRYGNRLDLRVDIKGDYENKMIAPLLMIPFVENCFKHGASIMRGNQWIHLTINIKDNELDFCLRNSKPLNPPTQRNKKNIGLMNVKKRLQLLYPERYFLEIDSKEDVYKVHLRLTLQEEMIAEQVQQPLLTEQSVYA